MQFRVWASLFLLQAHIFFQLSFTIISASQPNAIRRFLTVFIYLFIHLFIFSNMTFIVKIIHLAHYHDAEELLMNNGLIVTKLRETVRPG